MHMHLGDAAVMLLHDGGPGPAQASTSISAGFCGAVSVLVPVEVRHLLLLLLLVVVAVPGELHGEAFDEASHSAPDGDQHHAGGEDRCWAGQGAPQHCLKHAGGAGPRELAAAQGGTSSSTGRQQQHRAAAAALGGSSSTGRQQQKGFDCSRDKLLKAGGVSGRAWCVRPQQLVFL